MINKILLSFLFLALILSGVGFAGGQIAHAQVAPTFLSGCTSGLGYSITTGIPCNNTSHAIMMVDGCTTALGYSTTIASTPCDATSVAIQYLAGCTSIYGYSAINPAAACNGTSVASFAFEPTEVATPGLPVTGAGSNAPINMMLLLSFGAIALMGSAYLVKKYKTVA